MRDTAPPHDVPLAVTLHGTPSPAAAWREKAACTSLTDSAGVTAAGAKVANASASDAASLPAE
jgi:hypothetical protein